MIFLTYNDNYSGIYKSQVIDVCSFFEKEFKLNVKLVAFVSLRNYQDQKNLIRANYAHSTVVPMFPKVRFWKMNTFLLFFICLFSGKKKIWARGPFACNIALNIKKTGLIKKVLFDARGAYLAELTEYNVIPNETIKKNISLIEKRALQESDAQLAVSKKLEEWWKIQYSFVSQKSATVPCTLSADFDKPLPTQNEIELLRKEIGFSYEDIVIVYSGSSAGWQSFSLVDNFLYSIFSANQNVKLLFLSDDIPQQSKVFSHYKNRIFSKWVRPENVRNLLLAADYGLLIRENSITNQVASPVKFAEYLACGLQVIISENIGDFTEFVLQHHCGNLYKTESQIKLVPYNQKGENNKVALQFFSKTSSEIKGAYEKLLAN